jgi:hypothetical protein
LPTIEDYAFGRVVVDGETHTKDVVILADRVRANWWRRRGHEVCAEDLHEVLAASPEVVVIGTGAYGAVEVLAEARAVLEQAGAEIVAEPTAAACETFNRLRAEGREAVAALHLTC